MEDHVNERVLLNWILKDVRKEYLDRTYRGQHSVQWLPLTFMEPCIVDIFLSMTNKMQHCIIIFIIVNAVNVSSGFSAHHQELKSVHAASGICVTCLWLPLSVTTNKGGTFSPLPDHRRQLAGCIVPQAALHSQMLLMMGKIVARNISS